MVKGAHCAEARKVLGHRMLRGGLRTYDAQESPSDAGIMLREGYPELVRVSNCVAWFDMAALTDGKPKVVHPEEVKERGATVAGKAQHCTCGTQAMELDGGGVQPLAACTRGIGLKSRRKSRQPVGVCHRHVVDHG
jgi:hypothetical protein